MSDDSHDEDVSTAEMMKQIQETEKFWEASVEREKAAGDRYMGDVSFNYYTIDAERIEFLIGMGSAIITLVLALSILLARITGITIPVSVQISSTMAAVFLIDWYWHSEDGENNSDSDHS